MQLLGTKPIGYLEAWPRIWTRGYHETNPGSDQSAWYSNPEPLNCESDALITWLRCLQVGKKMNYITHSDVSQEQKLKEDVEELESLTTTKEQKSKSVFLRNGSFVIFAEAVFQSLKIDTH